MARSSRRLTATTGIVLAAVAVLAVGGSALARTSGSGLPLREVARVSLPGPSVRFDYTSLDPTSNRLYIAHMDASQLLVFDVRTRKVVKTISAPGVHGVIAVPQVGRVYASATDARQVLTIDARTDAVIATAPAGQYPDGIAYDPVERHVFVSDESGGVETVLNAAGHRIATMPLGGEAGNVQYDAGSGMVLADVQTRNDVAVIDPRTNRVVRRIPLPGCNHDHGLFIDASRRLAFVACDGNARLLTLDLRTTNGHRQRERRRQPRRARLRQLAPAALRLGRERRGRGLRRARTQPDQARPGVPRPVRAHRRGRPAHPPRLLPAPERIDRPPAAPDHGTGIGG